MAGGGQRLGSRATYAVVGLAAVLAVLLRLPFLHDLPYTDEGGMLVVARQWHTGGPFLYGHLFLDRPPLLMLLVRGCAVLGGIIPLRVLGLVLVVVSVVAAAWAGSVLAARRGACTAAVVTAALLAEPALGTREVNAETVGLPLTLLSVACVLEATRRPQQRRWLLLAGGALAVGAVLVKQNLADALAFGIVLVVAAAWSEGRRRAAATDLGWLALGAAVPVTATLAWAVTATPGVHELVYTLYGFRIDGGRVLLATGADGQAARVRELLRAAVESGLVPLLAVSLWLLRRRLLRDPLRLALLAMLAVAVLGVAGGGYYWTHYLLGLVPVTALLAALASGVLPRPRLLVVVVVAATVVSALVSTTAAGLSRTPADRTWVGGTSTWLRETEQPGDSLVVLYGQAALFETTGLRPAYPYLWTLPMRVFDPRLTRLRALLSGPDAPTFVVVDSPLDTWGIDPHGQMQHTIDRHYRRVGVVCGSPVYLRLGVRRTPAPPPTSCS